MAKYIEREALLNMLKTLIKQIEPIEESRDMFFHDSGVNGAIMRAVLEAQKIPAADVAPVVHGRWVLTVHSFYRDTFDESCELCVYIVAHCSECSGKHPNSYQVYSKTLYAPEDADNDFRFNQKAEEEKALLEFKQRKIEYANYCPNCGARMDGE